jgi:hypothetical protein
MYKYFPSIGIFIIIFFLLTLLILLANDHHSVKEEIIKCESHGGEMIRSGVKNSYVCAKTIE